jgi:Uma2 family endonuclease
LFIKKERLNILNTNYIDGPADLVIEVISPDSKKRDTEEKFIEYQSNKIKEYWLIDYENKSCEFFVLEKDKYQKVEPKGGIYYSNVLTGFWLKVDWLFEEPLPKIIELIKKYKLL